jgi:lipoate-protein ligase A
MPYDDRGVHETYAQITDAIRRGLETLGIADLDFSRQSPDFRDHYTRLESSSCFSASALNELTWNGRKLVGSAQRRYGNVLLQHGSLLCGDAHLDIAFLFRKPIDMSSRTLLRNRLAERTVTLADMLDGNIPAFDSIAEALVAGFSETFGVSLEQGDVYPNTYDVDGHGNQQPVHPKPRDIESWAT